MLLPLIWLEGRLEGTSTARTCCGHGAASGDVGVELHLASLVNGNHILSDSHVVLSDHVVGRVDADLHMQTPEMSVFLLAHSSYYVHTLTVPICDHPHHRHIGMLQLLTALLNGVMLTEPMYRPP